MRILSVLLLVLTLAIAQNASAQGAILNIYCEDCRDLTEYPEDARNFAVNQLFGSDSWLSMYQADRFNITDPFGNTVMADVNMQWILYDIPYIELPVPFPDTIVLQVRIIYENGNIVTYAFDIQDLNPNGALPVPAANSEPPQPPDTTGNNGDDEEDDFSEDEEENWNEEDDGWGDDDWGDDDWGDDGDCGGCEAYFDADEDGNLDDEPYDWTEEEEL